MKEHPDMENLKALLEEKHNFNKIWLLAIPLIGLVIAGVIIQRPQTHQLQAETLQPMVSKDTIVVYHELLESVTTDITATSPPEIPTNNSVPAKSSTQDYRQEIEKELPRQFAPMYALMDKAEELLADSLSTYDALMDISYEMAQTHSEIMLESYNYFEKKYSNINATEIQMTVAQSKAQTNLIKRWDEIQQRITAVIESRH